MVFVRFFLQTHTEWFRKYSGSEILYAATCHTMLQKRNIFQSEQKQCPNISNIHSQNDFVKTWFSFCSHSLARCMGFNGTLASTSYWISYLRKLHFVHSLHLFAHFIFFLSLFFSNVVLVWNGLVGSMAVESLWFFLSKGSFHHSHSIQTSIFSRCDIFQLHQAPTFDSILDLLFPSYFFFLNLWRKKILRKNLSFSCLHCTLSTIKNTSQDNFLYSRFFSIFFSVIVSK